MYSGHSINREAVQLYRSLNLRDEQIMEIVQMKGSHAYANYVLHITIARRLAFQDFPLGVTS